ncbi:MAG TPA: sulfite exporter TauE/SafE family protein [Acidimicrobiales bacterium]|nr:sulfite exporter TauE/SafE family protein [Acidimicrobiales bacterium]
MLDLVLSVLLGTAIGLSLGALGGGGSILTVPALVYALAVNAKDATGASLLIVGSSALIGMLAHGRAGRVRWSTGASVGAISVIGSLAGTALNRRIDPNLLLLIFAMLMFVVAGAMLRRGHAAKDAPAHDVATADPVPVAPRGHSTTRIIEMAPAVARVDAPTRTTRPLLVVAVGVGVGFLTGFLGVGGGFIVVPSLVLALGLGLAEAVGTSLLVIAMSSAIAIAERGGVHGVAPHILLPFAASAMVAAVAGNQIASRVPVRRLNQGFIVLVIAVACYVSLRSVLALG